MPTRFARSGRALARVAVLALLYPTAVTAQQRQNGLLVGRVLSGDVAVPGAAIIVSGGRVTLARVDGRYRLSLPAGRYEVRAQRIGYTSLRDSVTVTGQGTDTLNFRIERSPTPLEAVTSIGASEDRAAIDALAPVDVIEGSQLRATGRAETSRALQAAEASVNVSHQTTGQGSDLIHPFSMRGLSPDHVLVLVNGKRRHSSALVNVNRSLGRGSSGVDLDAIPASLIDRVEVLHGDAVAQYGSDAIAGVVNIVLKSGVHGFAATTGGAHSTTYNRDEDTRLYPSTGGERTASDGRAFQASIDKGVVFGERGFLHGGFELRDRAGTNRAVPEPGSGKTVDEHWGDPRTHDVALMLNGGNLFRNGMEAYANAGGTRRRIDAPTRVVGLSMAPPVIGATVDDYAGTVGVRGQMDDWRWDLSTVYGVNDVDLGLSPARNRADLLVPSQPSLDAGAQRLGEWTTNLELASLIPLFDETRVSLGAELRRDSYRVRAAEPAAYAVSTYYAPYWYGLSAFTPDQATDKVRNVAGGHLDFETDLTSILVLGVSGRLERYDDVKTQSAGKLSLRMEPWSKVVFRASAARGFRAPSLQQTWLRMGYLDANVSGGTSGTSVLLVPATDSLALSQGARPLRAERSTDLQAGLAMEITPALSFTLDAYRTAVRDRVLLADSYSSTNGGPWVHSFGNPADTRTDGLDATATYGLRFGPLSTLRLAMGANVNHTTVTAARELAPLEASRLERGTPRDNLLASATLAHHKLGAMLRTQRYGRVSGFGTGDAPTAEQTYAPRWVTDASLSYTLARKYTFTGGADNLLDVYPERSAHGVYPIFNAPLPQRSPYDGVSPFGFNGRYVYGRLSIYL